MSNDWLMIENDKKRFSSKILNFSQSPNKFAVIAPVIWKIIIYIPVASKTFRQACLCPSGSWNNVLKLQIIWL